MTNRTFLIGTGIDSFYVCHLTSHGQIQLINETKCGNGPSWLFPRNDLLYVVNEYSNKIETFTIDDRTQGKLTLKSTVSSIGNTPCSLDIDSSGKWLAVAKYAFIVYE